MILKIFLISDPSFDIFMVPIFFSNGQSINCYYVIACLYSSLDYYRLILRCRSCCTCSSWQSGLFLLCWNALNPLSLFGCAISWYFFCICCRAAANNVISPQRSFRRRGAHILNALAVTTSVTKSARTKIWMIVTSNKATLFFAIISFSNPYIRAAKTQNLNNGTGTLNGPQWCGCLVGLCWISKVLGSHTAGTEFKRPLFIWRPPIFSSQAIFHNTVPEESCIWHYERLQTTTKGFFFFSEYIALLSV